MSSWFRGLAGLWVGAWVVVCGSAAAGAQSIPSVPIAAEPTGETATVVLFNRPIAVLRARVLGRGPAERADGTRRALETLVSENVTGPVEWRAFEAGAMISVGPRAVLALTRPDVDELSGERVEAAAARAVDSLRLALSEAAEARAPGALFRSGLASAAMLVAALLLLWAIARLHRAAVRKLTAVAERTITRTGIVDVEAVRASRVLDVERWFLSAAAAALALVAVYAASGFVLRQFPYTRPWGESMRGFLVATALQLGLGIATAIPGLITVAIIVVIVRFLARLVATWFNAIERGSRAPRWIHPETAQPTRRLLTGLLWLFAIVVAYPYLPGSQTDAFKGVSVFLGLMVTFGSSGLVNHIMSGFMITYSRALRIGDFVRIGEVEGTVTHVGILSTKVMTIRREEATIPNAIVVSQTTTDYSRFSDTHGVLTPTSVTIGYDTPWRQVQSLLLLAADRTPGLRRDPRPIVLQTALEDFYVKYVLLVCLERQDSRALTLHTLHANIQDVFNEYGVQIMSPNYVLDPATPKIVKKADWFAAPARQEELEKV